MVFPFFQLPLEIREEIYTRLLSGNRSVWQRVNPIESESEGGASVLVAFMENRFQPYLLCINKQMSQEYSQVAYRHMNLNLLASVNPQLGPSYLLSLRQCPKLPAHVFQRLQKLTLIMRYHPTSTSLPQVNGLVQIIRETPALRSLHVVVTFRSETVDEHQPADTVIPAVRDFFTNFPEPAGGLTSIRADMIIETYMFEQIRIGDWSDTKEAKLLGEMWLSRDNKAHFFATPPQGPHTWHGLNLEFASYNISWEQLRERCIANPVKTGSPYVT